MNQNLSQFDPHKLSRREFIDKYFKATTAVAFAHSLNCNFSQPTTINNKLAIEGLVNYLIVNRESEKYIFINDEVIRVNLENNSERDNRKDLLIQSVYLDDLVHIYKNDQDKLSYNEALKEAYIRQLGINQINGFLTKLKLNTEDGSRNGINSLLENIDRISLDELKSLGIDEKIFSMQKVMSYDKAFLNNTFNNRGTLIKIVETEIRDKGISGDLCEGYLQRIHQFRLWKNKQMKRIEKGSQYFDCAIAKYSEILQQKILPALIAEYVVNKASGQTPVFQAGKMETASYQKYSLKKDMEKNGVEITYHQYGKNQIGEIGIIAESDVINIASQNSSHLIRFNNNNEKSCLSAMVDFLKRLN